jgi:outer membrane protein OmpA-like peptidoglycan-associated protein
MLMWARGIAAGAAWVMSAAAQAQGVAIESRLADLAGATRDLVFVAIDLVPSRPLDLEFRVENVSSEVQALQVRETATETRIELPADILFDFDKADIRAAAETALNQAAEVIRKGARGTVRIEGHTDGKGTPAYNQKLSERRAAAVRKWLAERAGLRVKFATKGFGAAKPVAPNVKPDGSDHPDGRQKNRRVEIVFGRS